MIVDFVTNSKEISKFVKDLHGGREEEIKGLDFTCYKLHSVALSVMRKDSLQDFYEDLEGFVRDIGIDMNSCGYRIFDWRRKMIREAGKLN